MNRLSQEHLAKWRAHYLTAAANFYRGVISEYDLMMTLMDLNFKNGALDVEIFELNRQRAIWRRQNGLN
jgi:hypothetical protein